MKLGVHIGIFKQKEEKGPYAWIDYESEEKIIRKFLRILFPLYVIDIIEDMEKGRGRTWNPIEFIEKIVIKYAAIEAGKDPRDKDLRKLAYKVFKQFSSKPEKFLPPEITKRFNEVTSKRFEELLSHYCQKVKRDLKKNSAT